MKAYVVVKPDNEVLGAYFSQDRALKLAIEEYKKAYGPGNWSERDLESLAEDWVHETEMR